MADNSMMPGCLLLIGISIGIVLLVIAAVITLVIFIPHLWYIWIGVPGIISLLLLGRWLGLFGR